MDYETPVEHPYFVFQHGWSSCLPEKTFKKFGLRCRQLQVGDVCVSLSRRLSQQNGTQAARKSSAPKSESTTSKSRHQGHGPDEHAAPTPPVPSRSDHQASSDARVVAASGVAGCGDGLTLSYKKNDLRIDTCNENNGLRFTHSNGDSNFDSGCSNSGGGSSNCSRSRNITHNGVNGLNGGVNFTRNLMNRHAVDEEGKKYEKPENDTNNNSNNISDKYGGLPSKKKRRWSAPDQMSDEYPNSPLSSPQSMSSSTSSVGSDVGIAARNA